MTDRKLEYVDKLRRLLSLLEKEIERLEVITSDK